MIDKSDLAKAMQERMSTNTFYAKKSTLADALGAEVTKEEKIRRARMKYGFPPRPPGKTPPLPGKGARGIY